MVRRTSRTPRFVRRAVVNRRRPNRQRRSRLPVRGNLPQRRSIMSSIYRTILQVVWDISQNGILDPAHELNKNVKYIGSVHRPATVSAVIDDGWILAHGYLDNYKKIFKEMKVHKINANYMPYGSPTDEGEYVFGFCDEVENDDGTFITTIGAPGTVVRKSGRPSRLVWFPTEPNDRQWNLIGTGHKFARMTVDAAESVYYDAEHETFANPLGEKVESSSVAGKVIADIDISFRGKPTKNFGLSNEQYCQLIKCQCPKCERFNRLKLMREENQSAVNYALESVQSQDGRPSLFRGPSTSSFEIMDQ